MIPSPSMILAAIFVALAAYFYGHHAGFAQRDQEMQAEIAAKNEEARTKEHELNKQLNAQSTKLQEANDAITQKQSDLDRAIRAGRVRFPSASCVQASTSAGPATVSGDAASSESDRETLAAIAAIVAQGDRNTEQLNACIAAYEQVKEAVNGQR
jgi:uncharacterized phage infection (PIP) family protein YhgE